MCTPRQGTIRGTIPNSLSTTAVFHVIMIHSDDDISDNCKVCSPTVHLRIMYVKRFLMLSVIVQAYLVYNSTGFVACISYAHMFVP